jgi:hypothetical protein
VGGIQGQTGSAGGQAAPKARESGQVGHRLTASPSFPDGLLVAGAASRCGRLPGAKFGTARWRRAGVYWPQAGRPREAKMEIRAPG